MHAKVESDQPDSIPFAYVPFESNNQKGWAIISAPPEQHAAIIQAVKDNTHRGTTLNLMRLIEAFNGKVTKSGPGPIPEEERKDLHMLYGGQDPEQGSLDI
ncbi:MAG: hypothetical protein IPH06_01200 [Alphaproteobacteria bacterium]|jgi:hypothetical protein|nr:hypothetical protein [Alphaproteobacteria bacterium]QQS56681.1 MAG: hypothetical protein IPN28_10455 [Alphaproteobacteria bacterium]